MLLQQEEDRLVEQLRSTRIAAPALHAFNWSKETTVAATERATSREAAKDGEVSVT